MYHIIKITSNWKSPPINLYLHKFRDISDAIDGFIIFFMVSLKGQKEWEKIFQICSLFHTDILSIDSDSDECDYKYS